MKEEKTGSVKELIFHNESNFYTILLFESTEEQFFAVGKMPDPRKGRSYRLTGEWTEHPKYGEQFAFSSFEELEPTSAEGIASFLASGIIKNVGPSTAMAIVRRFGDDTLRVIAEDPDKLTLVSGIGPVKAKAIAEGYAAHRSYAQVVLKLSAYDISPAVCMKLYKAYGSEAAEVVKENPYRLIDSIYGIGFVKADRIAQKLGIPADSPFRLRSAVVYDLEYHAGLGDTFVPETDLTEDVAVMLDVPREDVSSAIFDLALDGRVFKENLDGQNIVTLASYRRAENYCAAKLLQLINCDLTAIPVDPARLIKRSEKAAGIELSETQRRAVMSSLGNGVSIITGGPGTGKTTIIRMILSVLEEAGIPTELAAPTGRAAKRMTEATGYEARTIHRLLEVGGAPGEGGGRAVFQKNEDNPLEADVVIIDETSMVDILLFHALLKAILPGTHLILVGDMDQLPSVGPGEVLRDLISSEVYPSVVLKEIFRQAAGSDIIVNAHKINRGEDIRLDTNSKDFLFLERNDSAVIKQIAVWMLRDKLPDYCKTVQSEIQVLTPMRKGELGCLEMNRYMQSVLNPESPDKAECLSGENRFREGDKVMQTKNDYHLEWEILGKYGDVIDKGEGVFNGDIGVIKQISESGNFMKVEFDDRRLVTYPLGALEDLELAYAITIHKAQGSEYPAVILPLLDPPRMLRYRNLLYTGITRAKSCVVILGSSDTVRGMISEQGERRRYSSLKERILELEASRG